MPFCPAIARRALVVCRSLLCLGALFGCVLPSLAAVPELLRPARERFDFGRYPEAIAAIEALTAQKVLTAENELTEAWRIHGLSHLYLGDHDAARASFERLLALNPDYALDPLLVPPVAVDLLEEVRADKAAFLAPIRERRRLIAERRAREELEAMEARRATQTRQPLLIQRVERHSFFTNFLPLGAAQISQERHQVGVMFAIGQSLAVAGTIFTWVQFDSKVEADGKVRPENLDSARVWRVANWALFGTTLALYVGGVIDAVAHHREETVTEFEVPRPPGESPQLGDDAQLFIAPLDGGAAAGVFGTF